MIDLVLRKPALAIAFGVSVLFSTGLVAWFAIDHSLAVDFGVYWRVASEPLSQAYEHRRTLNFPYPPTMLLWVSPLALLPKWLAYGAFVAASVAAFILAVRPHMGRTATLLCLVSPPMVYCLLNGQVSALLAALLVWACGTERKLLAGIAFAVIASIKPQFVALAPLLWIIRRDTETFIVAGLAFLALLEASFLVHGFGTWAAWLDALPHFHRVLHTNEVLQVTVTPMSTAEYLGLHSLPFLLMGAALGSAVIYLCRDAEPLKLSAAIATASLLASPYAVIYDLVALVPFLAFSVMRGSILAAVALSGAGNAAPLLLTAFSLRPSGTRPATSFLRPAG